MKPLQRRDLIASKKTQGTYNDPGHFALKKAQGTYNDPDHFALKKRRELESGTFHESDQWSLTKLPERV